MITDPDGFEYDRPIVSTARVAPIFLDARWPDPDAIARSIQFRLEVTLACPNDQWHHSAPARAIELCPECVR